MGADITPPVWRFKSKWRQMAGESLEFSCEFCQGIVNVRMKPPEPSPGPLAESQKMALVSLLADDDPSVYQTVRGKLLSYGPSAAEWVKGGSLSDDPVLRRRSLEIIDYFKRTHADREFLAFCVSNGEQLDIERGGLLLAQTEYPQINLEAYSALLDSIASELLERLDLNGPAEDILNIINFHLFEEMRFKGNSQGFAEPQDNYLNRVLDRRTGNPASLCLVYLLIAKRLRLPMVGIGLPGYFLCRFQTVRDEIYIDAFNGGRLLGKADCVRYAVQIHNRVDEGYLAPVSPRRLLLRLCANLFQIYSQAQKTDQIDRVQQYLVALAQNG